LSLLCGDFRAHGARQGVNERRACVGPALGLKAVALDQPTSLSLTLILAGPLKPLVSRIASPFDPRLTRLIGTFRPALSRTVTLIVPLSSFIWISPVLTIQCSWFTDLRRILPEACLFEIPISALVFSEIKGI